MSERKTVILLLSCPDQKGIVAEVSNFIYKNNGNIIQSDQHTDFESNTYFMRIEWELEGFKIPRESILKEFEKISKKFNMKVELHFSDEVKRMAIMVSKLDHCLYEILLRKTSGELNVEIPLIISNHLDLKNVADYFRIDFYHYEVRPDNKEEVEKREIELLKKYNIDFVVLARYMQVLSPYFVNEYRHRIINIHHSFLPAFVGAKPYHQAYKRGVKLIGATSHYVTEELDNGPIIAQDVIRITHRDSLNDLIRKGKELEKIVLARAVKYHLENKILVFENRTVIFE
ncbi:MAG: formyltetrahydrofolate deformylase [Brevinematia bacterium]